MTSEISLSKEELLFLADNASRELISNGADNSLNQTLYCHEDSEPDDGNYGVSIELIHQWQVVGFAFFLVSGEYGKKATSYIVGEVFHSKKELDGYTLLGGWEVIHKTPSAPLTSTNNT